MATKEINMKKISWTLLLVLCCSSPCYSAETTKEGFYASGERKFIEMYQDGKLHGLKKFFYKSGELAIEQEYENGNPVGIRSAFYKNGAVRQKAVIDRSPVSAAVTNYYPDGTIYSSGTSRKFFDDNAGLIHAYEAIIYYPNGNIAYKRERVRKNFYEDIYFNEKGEKIVDGVVKIQSPEGKKLSEIHIKSGKKTEDKLFYENSQLFSESKYGQKGEPSGKIYWKNGVLAEEYHYESGKTVIKVYSKDGAFLYHHAELATGGCEDYDANGKLKRTGYVRQIVCPTSKDDDLFLEEGPHEPSVECHQCGFD